MSKSPNSIFIIGAILALMAGFWFAQSSNESAPSIKPEGIQGAIYPQAKVLNDFSLIDQSAKPYSKENLLNHWSLIFVGYTHCPDVCPTTMAVTSKVTEIMQEQMLEAPQIIFLTIDPERDTAEILQPYVTYFNKDFIGLTGALNEITQFSRELNAVFRKAPGADGEITQDGYLMDHSSALMLINPQGNLQSILTAPHTPGNIIESIIKSQTYYEAINSKDF